MPIYEYQCGACGAELEKLQKLSDAPLTDCPECKQPALKKKISAAGFRLSGSGWYETDFKKGSDKKKNLVDGADKADKSNGGSAGDGASGKDAKASTDNNASSGTNGGSKDSAAKKNSPKKATDK